jgi:3-hydroxybutyryl-CoA dehydrogenase
MKVAVFGAGLMGHAIALVHALGGHAVRLTDSNAATLAQAPVLMKAALATLREGGEADASWTDARLDAAVTCCKTVAETADGAEFIVEAITERPDAKRALYAEIDRSAPMTAILASNTSGLDIFPLVPERRQARTLITHWYTPPYLVDLCDVVGSDKTDPAVIETVRKLIADMGKVPLVMKKFIPGYIANRIQAAIGLEVQHLVDEGYASARDIDEAMIHGLALRIPILAHMAKADFTGLLVIQDLAKHGGYRAPEPRGQSETLDKLIAEGRTGVMAGRGYFDWGGRSPDELFRERDRKLLALKRALRQIGRMEGT